MQTKEGRNVQATTTNERNEDKSSAGRWGGMRSCMRSSISTAARHVEETNSTSDCGAGAGGGAKRCRRLLERGIP